MKRLLVLVLAFGLLAVVPLGCNLYDSGDDVAACSCEKGKAGEAVWCESCSKGYVGGNAVACKGCFAEKTGGPACEGCAAKKEGG